MGEGHLRVDITFTSLMTGDAEHSLKFLLAVCFFLEGHYLVAHSSVSSLEVLWLMFAGFCKLWMSAPCVKCDGSSVVHPADNNFFGCVETFNFM